MIRPRCDNCGVVGMHNEQYDSYYCPECKEWLESRCSDEDCEICAGKPANAKELEQVVQ